MKTILALATVLIMGTSAYAQTGGSPRHMIEFDADSVLQGTLNFDRSNAKGGDVDNDTQLKLNLNYAYALSMMPNLQVGGKLDYWKGTEAGRGDFEDYGLGAGVIWNMSRSGQAVDLRNSFYASVFVGLEWAKNYSGTLADDEVFGSTFAVGKRFELARWGVTHLTYSPEVALESLNSTTGGALEYSQSVQLRFLQFSVLF